LLAGLHHEHGDAIIETAEIFAALEIDLLRALGGDRFPSRP
jgi:hypothetical protein